MICPGGCLHWGGAYIRNYTVYYEAQLPNDLILSILNCDYPTYLHLELHNSILEPLGNIKIANQNPYKNWNTVS